MHARIEISGLKERKSELNWATCITVRRCNAYFEAKSSHVVQRLLTCLESGSIAQDNGVLSPVFVFWSQLSGQLRQEQTEDIGVRVHLRQRTIEFSICSDRHEHWYSWMYILDRNWVGISSLSPLAALKVGLVDPCLINVDHSLVWGKHIDHELGVLLSQDLASIWVSLERNLLYLLILKT